VCDPPALAVRLAFAEATAKAGGQRNENSIHILLLGSQKFSSQSFKSHQS
jgi:hypothetical protein